MLRPRDSASSRKPVIRSKSVRLSLRTLRLAFNPLPGPCWLARARTLRPHKYRPLPISTKRQSANYRSMAAVFRISCWQRRPPRLILRADKSRWPGNAALTATCRLTAPTTTIHSSEDCAGANAPIRLLRFPRAPLRNSRLSPLATTLSSADQQAELFGSVGGPFPIARFGEGGRNHYGGKDKSFFFVAYEQQKLLQSRAVLMNNLRQAGIMSGTIASGIDEALNFSLGKEGPYKQTNDAKVFLTRFDFNFSPKHQLNVRYNYSLNNALNAVTAGTSLTPTTNSALSNNGTEGDNSNTFVGQLTSFLTSTTINEFRGQYSKENQPRLANVLWPEIRANYGIFGTVNFLPTTESDYRVQFADNLTLLRGSHTWKVGGEYNFVKASQVFAFRQFGSYQFANLGTDASSVIRILRILSAGGNTTTANANGNVTGTILDPVNRFDDTNV